MQVRKEALESWAREAVHEGVPACRRFCLGLSSRCCSVRFLALATALRPPDLGMVAESNASFPESSRVLLLRRTQDPKGKASGVLCREGSWSQE